MQYYKNIYVIFLGKRMNSFIISIQLYISSMLYVYKLYFFLVTLLLYFLTYAIT